MNNISKLLLGAAALVGLASCSNDEPVVGPEGNGVSTTDIAYLNIKIASPDDVTSRAADDPFGYKDYGKSERIIDNAWFFFYYADGKYANVKTNQFLADTDDQNMPNVEYRSKGTIILKGLTDKQYPSYVVTVLNLPNYETFVAPSTLAGWLDLTWDNSYSGTGDDKRFVMLTSSYYDTNRTTTGADNGNQPVYFATPLVEANFLKEEPKEEADDANRVQIYVERLAARVEVKSGLEGGVTKNVGGKNIVMYPANRTVGGEDNGEAETDLYVSFDGWDLTTTATKTLAAKSLEGFAATDGFDKNWKWNDADYFRSYWGKSFVYGKSGDELKAALKMDKTWQDLNQVVGNDATNSTVAYCNENTNYFENIWGTGKLADPAKATTVLLKATARDKDGNPMDLVEFRGVHYTKEGFINNALNIADMPYAVRTVDKTYTGKNEAGEDETFITYKYTTLGKEYFDLASAKDGVTGSVNVVVNEGTYYLPDATAKTKIMTIGEEKVTITYYDATEVTKATIDSELKSRVHVNNEKAIAATGGAMYYPIVIEHLNFAYADGKKVAEKDIVRDGMIGVVRNHAYTINVTKINGLGKGVFIPTDIEGGDNAEPIIPEGPQDPTYYVESTINILSWKLVEQDAEI